MQKDHTKKKIQFIDSQIKKYDNGRVTRFQYITILANKFKPTKYY